MACQTCILLFYSPSTCLTKAMSNWETFLEDFLQYDDSIKIIPF